MAALTDHEVREVYQYDAYGQPTILDRFGGGPITNSWGTAHSAIGNPWMFTGRQFDEETGLYFYRARYYDPVKGRFLQRDPIGIWGDPANLGNKYAYVGNNPSSATDPMGRRTCKWYQFGCLACKAGCATAYWARVTFCYANQAVTDAACAVVFAACDAQCFTDMELKLVAAEQLKVGLKAFCFVSGSHWRFCLKTGPMPDYLQDPNEYDPTTLVDWIDIMVAVLKAAANSDFDDCKDSCKKKFDTCKPNLSSCLTNAANKKSACDNRC